MSAYYTVSAVEQRGFRDNPHGGKLAKWSVSLRDDDDNVVTPDVYWQTKPDREIENGQRVYGDLTEGEFGWRFRSAQRPDQSSPSTAAQSGSSDANAQGAGASSNAGPPPRNGYDNRSARIERQHHHGMSVQVMAVRFPNGIPGAITKERLREAITEWTDWFAQDLEKAASARNTKEPTPSGEAVQPGRISPEQAKHLEKRVEELHLLDKDVIARAITCGSKGGSTPNAAIAGLGTTGAAAFDAWLGGLEAALA